MRMIELKFLGQLCVSMGAWRDDGDGTEITNKHNRNEPLKQCMCQAKMELEGNENVYECEKVMKIYMSFVDVTVEGMDYGV